ncbi:MAG: sugar kinase [Spirochaetia bacterium]|jgi:2-dehydro-3-deoxygluconokinase|nr:sugar kinase [Spirochaetia bacterium]
MKVVSFGEVMLRLKSPGLERLFQSPSFEATFGGSEANVAVALARLGNPAAFVTVLPDNQIGRECVRELRYHGVDVSLIAMKKGRMGIYFFENGSNQRPSNVIYDRAGSAIAEIESGDIDWDKVFAGAGWFHLSGITPAISRKAADASIAAVKAAGKAGLKISFDLNYRAKLWNYGAKAQDVMGEIASYAQVLIGNEEDYQKSLGLEGPKLSADGSIDTSEYAAMCDRALARYPKAEYAAVTLRESRSADSNGWSAMLASRKTALVSRKYSITDIVDRVGAGDSFSAGLIYGLINFKDDAQKALEHAVALSCLKHTISGDFALIEPGEAQKLMGGDASGRVQR